MSNKNKIVIITDCVDVAYNETRGVIVSELQKLGTAEKVEIEPIVEAKEFSVINGAFLTRLLADSYPPDLTTFLVILNPLKTDRIDRARIIGETLNGIKFVGENTGTLGWLIKDFGVKQIFESSRRGIDGKEFISFGGKYIHAPICAQIASGVPLPQIGMEFDRKRLAFPTITDGTVVHIDNFGVIKMTGSLNIETEQKVILYCNGVKIQEAIYTDSMKNLPDGTLALYKGSSLNNLPEIGKVRKLGTAEELKVKIGDIITWNTY